MSTEQQRANNPARRHRFQQNAGQLLHDLLQRGR